MICHLLVNKVLSIYLLLKIETIMPHDKVMLSVFQSDDLIKQFHPLLTCILFDKDNDGGGDGK